MATFEPETPITIYHNKPVFASRIKADDLQTQMSLIVDSLMRCCFKTLSPDNLSIILICFENFKRMYENLNLEPNAEKLKQTKNSNIVNYTFKYQEPGSSKSKKSVSPNKRSSKSTLIGGSGIVNLTCN